MKDWPHDQVTSFFPAQPITSGVQIVASFSFNMHAEVVALSTQEQAAAYIRHVDGLTGGQVKPRIQTKHLMQLPASGEPQYTRVNGIAGLFIHEALCFFMGNTEDAEESEDIDSGDSVILKLEGWPVMGILSHEDAHGVCVSIFSGRSDALRLMSCYAKFIDSELLQKLAHHQLALPPQGKTPLVQFRGFSGQLIASALQLYLVHG